MKKNIFSFSNGAVASSLVLTLLSPLAGAAGLNEITVHSALGQPLRAEIRVSATAKEILGMEARLASPEIFANNGIEYAISLRQLRFKVEERGGGAIIRVTSDGPINDPIMSFMLDLTWPDGRLTKEYTFLLDPVDVGRGTSASTMPDNAARYGSRPPVSQSVQVNDRQPEVQQESRRGRRAVSTPSAKPDAKAESKSEDGGVSHTVQKGETLHSIARKYLSGGVTLEQMVVALYRGNAAAFENNDPHRLRAGSALRIPSAEEARKLPQNEARDIYRSTFPVAGSGQEAAASRPVAGARQTSASAEDSAREREMKAREREIQRYDDRANKLEQDAERLRKKLDESEKKIAAEQERLSKLQEAADYDDRADKLEQDVARLKKQLEDSEKRIEAEQERLDKEQHVVVDTEEKVATGDAVPEAGMEEMPVEVTPAEDLPPVALPQQKDVTPPAQSPGALDEAVGAEEGGMDMLTWGGGAVLLALVGSLAFLARRRKARKDDLGWPVSMPRTMPQPPRKAREELEESDWHSPSSAESALGQSGLSEKGLDSVSQPATTGQSVDAGNEATQPFGQDQALPDSHPDTYEGDPVEEADVYISYGRDAQAEELLLDALPKNPNRIEIRLKLLEIYANRKSLRDFEVIAKEIQAQTGGKGPDWDKVVTMGAALDPDNPLYGGSGLGGASSASKSAEEEALLAHMRTDSDIPSVPDDDSLLQMLGKDSEAQKPMDSDQDFGLEAAEQTEKRSPPPEPVPPKPAETESEPEFAFDEEPVSAPEPESPSVPEQFVEDEVATTAMDQGAMETQANPEPAFAKTLTRAEETEGMNLPGLDMESEAMMEDMEAEGSTLTSRDDAQGEDAAFEMRPTESAPSDSAGSLDGLSNIDLDLREPPSAEETPEAELPFAEEAQEELSAPAGEIPDELEAMGDMESPDAKREEVNTKLDLAKVYEEMGDLEGARELLKEVVNEGTPSQVEQAKATLARLNP